MSSLKLRGLTKTYGGRTTTAAVDALDLEVEEGELLVLLGPSGCGKTTTLRMVAGLERPTGGTVLFGDRPVYDAERGIDLSPDKRDIGMVFQSFALWPHMTVRKNIAYPLKVRRLKQGLAEGWVEQAARLVDCEALLDRYPSQLSGGQQQRVALARAIVSRPSFLLFDEPLSNLDARLRDQLRAELHRLHGELGFTGLYVTHDQSEAMALGDRLVIMRQGRIEQVGRPRAVFERPATEYVADFIGITNWIDVEQRAHGWGSPAGELVGTVPGRLQGDGRVRFRSEDARIIPDGSPLPDGVVGVGRVQVADLTYGGRTFDVIVDLHGGGTAQARIPAEEGENLDRGTVVSLVVPVEAVLLYGADGVLVPTVAMSDVVEVLS